ncbi:MAG TPA: protein translocase subunit SecD, partial [Candidatus Paceibacterota bacterium]|nr:protein translocase subunit SecD [Candidatus Paceibacterota bacterium]
MWRKRILALLLLLAGAGIGYFDYISQVYSDTGFGKFPFKYGLDISGGTHLVYRADTAAIPEGEMRQSMDALRDVIERRVNLFGVGEPIVQVEEHGAASGEREQRLIVELPGVTDIDQAVEMIGATPILEFKAERPDGPEKQAILDAIGRAEKAIELASSTGAQVDIAGLLAADPMLSQDPYYVLTPLSGQHLKKATLAFDQRTNEPRVVLEFTDEGKRLFAEITEANIGKTIAIYLDQNPVPISAPVVREAITDGNAEISGTFTIPEAKELVGRLNSGALPVPVELLSTQTIGASLGEKALNSGVRAGVIGVLAVAIFLILWYRLPGLIATLALGVYIAIMLAIFKMIPVTLTAAGIAGFILSIGMAVDANILIFERMKEELKKGKDLDAAMHDGFARAWLSIRDSNVSSIISTLILFWFGTSLIKGFALTLLVGVLVSMFSAITVTRTLLLAVGMQGTGRAVRFLFSS